MKKCIKYESDDLLCKDFHRCQFANTQACPAYGAGLWGILRCDTFKKRG